MQLFFVNLRLNFLMNNVFYLLLRNGMEKQKYAFTHIGFSIKKLPCTYWHVSVAVFPGHGIVIKNPVEIITYYINHRNTREAQILTALKANGGKLLTTLQVVNIVYKVMVTMVLYLSMIGTRCQFPVGLFSSTRIVNPLNLTLECIWT